MLWLSVRAPRTQTQECVKIFSREIIPEMKGNVASDEILSSKVQDSIDSSSTGPFGHV